MSVINWSNCPRCARLAGEEHEQQKIAADVSYSKVPRDEFLELQAVANLEPRIPSETLREDYEFWYIDAGLRISYSGTCQDCGLEISFEHTEPMKL